MGFRLIDSLCVLCSIWSIYFFLLCQLQIIDPMLCYYANYKSLKFHVNFAVSLNRLEMNAKKNYKHCNQ